MCKNLSSDPQCFDRPVTEVCHIPQLQAAHIQKWRAIYQQQMDICFAFPIALLPMAMDKTLL